MSPNYACEGLPAGSRDRAWDSRRTINRAIVGEETEYAHLEFGVLPALAYSAQALSSYLIAAKPSRGFEYSDAVPVSVSWRSPSLQYVH